MNEIYGIYTKWNNHDQVIVCDIVQAHSTYYCIESMLYLKFGFVFDATSAVYYNYYCLNFETVYNAFKKWMQRPST